MLPTPLSQTLYGFIGSQVLLTADELGVFDALAKSGSARPDEVAQRTRASTGKMKRLLNAAASFGLVRKTDDRYELDGELRRYLDPASAEYCGGLLDHFRKNTLPAFSRFREEIESEHSPGRLSAPFSAIYEDAEATQSFLDAMWGIGYPAGRELAEADIFESAATLVDVGGATGSFSIALLERRKDMRARIFDLPEVAPYFEARLGEHPAAAGRIDFVPGDFWTDAFPAADIYAFGYIFSDWSDQDCLELARKAYAALPAGGRIVVLEKLLDEGGISPHSAVMQDMAMMMETGGRHRSQSEYEALLRDAGFVRASTIRSSGEKHIVTAVKPQ